MNSFLRKKTIISIGVVLSVALVAALGYWYSQHAKNKMVSVDTLEEVVREDLGFAFSFLSGESALSFIQSTPDQLTDPAVKQVYVLMESGAQQAFLSGETTKTPPTISVFAFTWDSASSTVTAVPGQSTSISKLVAWAEEHNGYTNFKNKIGDFSTTTIDGAPAIHFTSEALYPQDTYIVKSGSRYYLFVGQYESLVDTLHQAFETLMGSVVIY